MTTMKERPIIFSADLRWVKVAASRIGISTDEYLDALNRRETICGGCKKSLPRTVEFFGKESKTFDQLRSRCKRCVSKSKKTNYILTRPQQRAKQLLYQRANRNRIYTYNAAWQRRRCKQVRDEMLKAYGGKCACCGETEPLFLELDHICNDGAEDRRRCRNQFQIILKLQAEGWPGDRFQLLCSNCNQGKNRNGGVCPHQKQK